MEDTIFSHWVSPSLSSGSGEATWTGVSVSPRLSLARKAVLALLRAPVSSSWLRLSPLGLVGRLFFVRIRDKSLKLNPSMSPLASGSALLSLIIFCLRDFLTRPGDLEATLVLRLVLSLREASW